MSDFITVLLDRDGLDPEGIASELWLRAARAQISAAIGARWPDARVTCAVAPISCALLRDQIETSEGIDPSAVAGAVAEAFDRYLAG